MGLPDRLKKVLVEKLPITVDTQQFIRNPKIAVDPKLIRKIKNDPSILSNPDFVEQTLNRYPGLDLQTLRRYIEEA